MRRYLAYGTLMSRQHPPSLAFLACDSYDAWVGQGVYTRIRQGLAEGGGPDGRDQCRSRSALLTMSPGGTAVPCGKHGREVLRRQLIVGPGAPLASFYSWSSFLTENASRGIR